MNSYDNAEANNGQPVAPPTDVQEKYVVKIEGPSGPCFIASVGGMPEREFTFVYRDKDYYFYFYADRSWDGNDVYDVDVRNATTQRFTGPNPAIRLEDRDRIKENIKTFFEQRDFFSSKNLRPATEQFRNLTFSWWIGK